MIRCSICLSLIYFTSNDAKHARFIYVVENGGISFFFFLNLFLAALGLHCSACASHCIGFSCCGARALGTWASVVVAHGLSSCGSRAQLLHGMWDLPGPELEPVSPALAGGFLTTAPPGKPSFF